MARSTRGYAKPTPQARKYRIAGTSRDGLRRARQIVLQRTFTYERQPTRCIRCGTERDPKKHPVCDDCTRRRMENT